jgi:hypothetical protein
MGAHAVEGDADGHVAMMPIQIDARTDESG